MNKLDIIIDALEIGQELFEFPPKDTDLPFTKALAAARELRDMKPVAWVDEIAEEASLMLDKPQFRAIPLYALGESND